MRYLGDFPLAGAVYFCFSTQKADGTPITLAGTPAVVVRKNDSAAPLALDPAPVLTVDFNGVTGLHNVKVDLADSDFVAGDYDACLSAGTVDGISVAGRVLAHFSVNNRTVATVENKIDTIDSNVDAILADTGTDGVVVAPGSKTGYGLAADQSGVTIGTVNSFAAGAVASVWNALLTGITTAGSIGKLIKDYLDAAITSRLASVGYTAPDNAGITQIMADIGSLNNLSDAEVQVALAAVMDDYDPPTRAEATSDANSIKALLPAALVNGKMDANATVDTSGLATHQDAVDILAAVGAESDTSYSDTVTDAQGQPVDGAEVRAWAAAARTGQPLRSVRTDELGTFAFLGLPAGTYYGRVEGTGIRTADFEFAVTEA
jgi:hypothetical protein